VWKLSPLGLFTIHIEKLYIRNFRNFSEVAVPFATPVTAIIGPNNVGKSNLLAALRLLFDPALSRQARLLEKEDFHEKTSVDDGREILISAILSGFENNARRATDGIIHWLTSP